MADKKRLFQPQLKEKWLFGMEPLEPIALGPHCQRWYKGRDKLPPNYLAKHRNRLLKCPMDTWRWISMREGLDDCRMGCLPADNLIIRGPREGFLPTTAHRVPRPPSRKTQKKLPKGAELLSKLSPAQQAQKAFVEEMEACLTPHPLAGCDLKEILPPDLLLKVLEETEPDKKPEDTWGYCEGMKDRKKSSTQLCGKCPEEVNPGPPKPSQPGASQSSQPGSPKQVNLGPPSQVNWDVPSKSTWDLLANSTGDLLNKSTGDLPANSTGDLPANSTGDLPAKSTGDLPDKSTRDLPAKTTRDLPSKSIRDPPSKSTRDLPAKLTWEQLVKSSWDLLAKSTRNSRPSQPAPPKQVNRGPPGQVNWGPPKQVNRGTPGQVNRGLPKQVNREPPKQVNRGPPSQLNREPPKQVNREPPKQMNRGTPKQVNRGSPRQVNRGTPGQVNRGHPKQISRGTLGQVSRGTLRQLNRGTPGQLNRGLPKQVNRGPPSQVNQGPPKKVNQGPPSQVTLGPPKRVNWGPPGQVTLGPPKQVTWGPPNQVNQGPPYQVTLGPPNQLTQGPPNQVTSGPPDQVNQVHPKDSFLSYLMKLFPEEKKKKSSRKGIPDGPDPCRCVQGKVHEFCRWTDTFGDMGIDEKFIMKQSELDECTPNHNTGKIKKATQIPVELYYSKGLDDNKNRELALQEGNWERKLEKPPDLYTPKQVKIRYGEWYLNPNTWKKQINDELWVGPTVLKGQKYQSRARDLEPDILDDLYGPIAFKDFIVSKGYRMPGVIEKLFLRKKWTYDSVKTPIDQVMKLLSKVPDDTSEDD